MPKFEQAIFLRLVSQLQNALGRLESLQKLSQKEFMKDPDKIGSCKYQFIVAIESCIDMCNHIIARNGYRVPEDYGDTFKVIAEAGVIDETFAIELRNMAKFRNRLVHLYWEINDVQVYDILQTRLKDFKKLIKALYAFLNIL
ncbi:MAG: DUF86 domain-containing protein [Desulfobacterales bacterium]|jgi:uncharacterized protein YutE (UPF0331/DUF86 family)|nr:DUF86 domain-containing protein [Desulfobacterales bacterium]